MILHKRKYSILEQFMDSACLAYEIPERISRNPVFSRRRHLLYDACWITSNRDEFRHVLGHDAPCADSNASSNGDTRQNDAVAAEPAVRAYLDGLPILWSLSALPQDGIKRVRSTIERAIWADQSTIANLDGACVQPYAIEIDVHVLSQSAQSA